MERVWLISRVLRKLILTIVGSFLMDFMEERVFRDPSFIISAVFTSLTILRHKELSSLSMLAKWEKPFNPGYTRKSSPFLVGKRTTVKVPMMHQVEEFAFAVDPELNCSVLRMDYGGDTAAFFVLPGRGKMRQLEQALSARTLRKWSRLLQKRWESVSVSWGLRRVVGYLQGRVERPR